MKKLILLSILACLFTGHLAAKGDRFVKRDELPKDAQAFLASFFSDSAIKTVLKESKSNDYEVVMNDGMAFDFDERGSWKEVDCNDGRVPLSIVPSKMLNVIAKTYGPVAEIIWIQRTKKGYQVELSNGVEIGFNKRYKIIPLKH